MVQMRPTSITAAVAVCGTLTPGQKKYAVSAPVPAASNGQLALTAAAAVYDSSSPAAATGVSSPDLDGSPNGDGVTVTVQSLAAAVDASSSPSAARGVSGLDLDGSPSVLIDQSVYAEQEAEAEAEAEPEEDNDSDPKHLDMASEPQPAEPRDDERELVLLREIERLRAELAELRPTADPDAFVAATNAMGFNDADRQVNYWHRTGK
jgi:hypothetical protein